MTAASFKAWINQPSTILGFGAMFGTISAIIAHVLTHDETVTAGAGGIAFAIVHMVLPDNSAAGSSVEKLVTDAVTAAAQRKLAATLPLLIQDGLAVVNAITSPAPVPVPVTTTTTTTTQPAPAPVVVPVSTVATTTQPAAPVVAPTVVQSVIPTV